MKTIDVEEMPKYIEDAPVEMPLLFIGDTGIGKTAIIKRWAKENGYKLKCIILSQMRADEALGVPVMGETEFNGKKYKTLETATPSWVFDLAKEKKAVLFVDELLTGKPDEQNAFLNFFTEKEVNGIDLSHVRIVAATNVSEYSYDPDLNILSRFCMFYTVNGTYEKFIGDPRVSSDYVDPGQPDSIVFKERSLKPRCKKFLKSVNDDLLDDFYQGFTNKHLTPTFSDIKKVQNMLNGLYLAQADRNAKLNIGDMELTSFGSFLKSNYSRMHDCEATIRSLTNVTFDDTIENVIMKINSMLEIK
jgi:hypothetical protein